MIEWLDLFTALALVLVIEGIVLFANARGVRRTLRLIEEMSDTQLRYVGAIAMGLGVVMLYVIRS